MKRIGFIGTGEMAAPMVRFLARKGYPVTVSERSKAISSALAAEFEGVTVADNQGVVDASEIVFLALRPQHWKDGVAGLKFREDQQIVSVMAGVPLAQIATVCAPVADISVTMPIAALEQGGCPLPTYPKGSPMEVLFAPENPVLAQPSEAAILSHFAASTMASATFDMLDSASRWLAGQTGDADMAQTYVTALIAAIMRDVPLREAAALAAARDALATPNTLNLQMVEALGRADLETTIHSALSQIEASMGSAE